MNILVTGASKGIGRVIAKELTGNVYVTGRNEEALKSLNASDYCVCDLEKSTDILCDFIVQNEIDVLVNNAGEYIYGSIDKMSTDDINRIFEVNLAAPAKLIAAAVPYMKGKKWGRIVNIGSISGVMGEANASLYSASKAGLIGLALSNKKSILTVILGIILFLCQLVPFLQSGNGTATIIVNIVLLVIPYYYLHNAYRNYKE